MQTLAIYKCSTRTRTLISALVDELTPVNDFVHARREESTEPQNAVFTIVAPLDIQSHRRPVLAARDLSSKIASLHYRISSRTLYILPHCVFFSVREHCTVYITSSCFMGIYAMYTMRGSLRRVLPGFLFSRRIREFSLIFSITIAHTKVPLALALGPASPRTFRPSIIVEVYLPRSSWRCKKKIVEEGLNQPISKATRRSRTRLDNRNPQLEESDLQNAQPTFADNSLSLSNAKYRPCDSCKSSNVFLGSRGLINLPHALAAARAGKRQHLIL